MSLSLFQLSLLATCFLCDLSLSPVSPFPSPCSLIGLRLHSLHLIMPNPECCTYVNDQLYLFPSSATELHEAKPVWPVPDDYQSPCAEGQIECGSGECLSRSLFCDGAPDCADGSDENICSEFLFAQ